MPTGVYPRPSLEDRFWSFVTKTPTCWLWTGCTDHFGYGWISEKGKPEKAHRISFRIHNGPIPKGKQVLHTCDDPPCTRPDHLYLGTHKDNMKDMADRGRMARGENAGQTILTEAQARIIKYSTERSCDVARKFSISPQAVCCIRKGRRWGWL